MAPRIDMTNVDNQVSRYANLGRLAIEHFVPTGEEAVLGIRIYHIKSNEAGQNTKFRMHIFTSSPHGIFSNIAVFGALEFLDWKVKQIEEEKGEPWKYDKVTTHGSLPECEAEVAQKIKGTIKFQNVTPDFQGDLPRRVADELACLLAKMPIAAHSLSEVPIIPHEGPRPIAALPPIIPASWDEGW
jgi:hypothetical protein